MEVKCQQSWKWFSLVDFHSCLLCLCQFVNRVSSVQQSWTSDNYMCWWFHAPFPPYSHTIAFMSCLFHSSDLGVSSLTYREIFYFHRNMLQIHGKIVGEYDLCTFSFLIIASNVFLWWKEIENHWLSCKALSIHAIKFSTQSLHFHYNGAPRVLILPQFHIIW